MIEDSATKTDKQLIQELEWQVQHLRRRCDDLTVENNNLHREIRALNELAAGDDR